LASIRVHERTGLQSARAPTGAGEAAARPGRGQFTRVIETEEVIFGVRPRAFYVGEIPRNGWKIMDVAYRMSCRGAQNDLIEIRVAEDLRARVGGLKKTRIGYDM